MAERGCVDNYLPKEVDCTKVSAFVESRLTSPRENEFIKTVTGHLYNNGHVGRNTIQNTQNVSARPENEHVHLRSQVINHTTAIHSIRHPQNMSISSVINSNAQNMLNSVKGNASSFLTSPSTYPAASKPNAEPTYIHYHNSTMLSQAFPGDSPVSEKSAIRLQQPSPMENIGAASVAMHNLASIAAVEQGPLTVLSNRNALTLQNKDIFKTPQYFVKSGANNVTVKREMLVHNSLPLGMNHIIPKITRDHHEAIKIGNNPSFVTVQAYVQNAVQSTVFTTSSPAVEVTSTAPSGVMTQIQTAHTHISSPTSTQQANLIQKQQVTPQTNMTSRQHTPAASAVGVPSGSVLMRNGSGQLVLVSAPPTSTGGVSRSMAGNITIQNSMPVTSRTCVRPTWNGQTDVKVHSQNLPSLSSSSSSLSSSQQQQMQDTVTSAAASNTSSHLSNGLVVTVAGQPTPVIANGGSTAVSGEINKAMAENVKKCKNFLSTLIKLAQSQPAKTAENVRELIQGLMDGKVEPELFTVRLQQELQSSPQPHLVSFLKKNLPLLRQFMKQGQMTIEGIKPSSSGNLGQAQSASQSQAPNPVVTTHVVTTARPLVPKYVTAAQAIVTSSQQLPMINSSSSASIKLVSVGQALDPSGTKAILQTVPMSQHSQQYSSLTNLKLDAKSVSQVIRNIRPVTSTPTIKKEHSASGQKAKRKFESTKDGDDDINDVATMGGVNLSEESRNILATTNADFIGAQSRSCQDETFLAALPLLGKITSVARKFGVEEVSPAVVSLISHATQERLKDMVSKLSTIAEHRVEIYKADDKYEIQSKNRLKLKFLGELEKLEKKRREEQEKEKLFKAARSRSKPEDPEQIKLKQRAREFKQAEAEELRQRQTNLTALEATQTSKKRRVDFLDTSRGVLSSSGNNASHANTSSSISVMLPRMKRVTVRDMQLVLEGEVRTRKSTLLYRTFLK